ncbi:MAG: hypothetical protein LBP61_09620 [Desulfovibrio sp.]|jgi:hypothetical protein|nr:hypothetical protein [Desulfovibrio sp.]
MPFFVAKAKGQITEHNKDGGQTPVEKHTVQHGLPHSVEFQPIEGKDNTGVQSNEISVKKGNGKAGGSGHAKNSGPIFPVILVTHE